MMGWVMLGGLAVAAGLLLLVLGFPRRLWMVAATALVLGATGYVWQGSPGQAGSPVTAAETAVEIDPEMIQLREAMFGRFGAQDKMFIMADALTRAGSPDVAAKAMVSAANGSPNDAGLWTWAGVTLAASDANQLSPASRYAFDRALALTPNHPGPPFFLGLTLVREGKFAEARPYWVKAAELTPKDASYRGAIYARVMALDLFLADQAGQGK